MRYLIIVFCLLSLTSYSQVNLRVKGVMPLPSQTGNSGRYLTTNGSAASWGNITLISDTSRIVTIDKTQTITGLKTFNAALGIGGSANASAAFDVTSTTQGTRPFPTMTTAQRNAISSPATGLLIFNSTDSVQQYYNGATWIDLGDQRTSRAISIKDEIIERFIVTHTNTLASSASGSGSSAGTFLYATGSPSFDKGVGRLVVANAASSSTLRTPFTSNGASFHPRLVTGNPYIFETRVRLDTCNATDTLLTWIGLEYANSGNTTSLSGTFGGFIYDPRNTLGQGSSRFIRCVTGLASTWTTTLTNVVFDPNTWVKLKFVCTSTYWLFYINDVLVATHTTNLPNNTSIGYSWGYRLTKTVTSANASMGMFIDYWTFERYLDTKR